MAQSKQLQSLKSLYLAELALPAEPWAPHLESESVLLARLKRKAKTAAKKRKGKEGGAEGEKVARKIVVGGYPFVRSKSEKCLEDMGWMDLSDLHLRGTHLGGYLLFRFLPRPHLSPSPTSPLPNPFTHTLPICSPDGRAALLHLHNYPLLPSTLGAPTTSDLDATFPVGSTWVVREPTVRRDIGMGDGGEKGGEWVVWVEDEGDLERVGKGSEVLDGQEWVGSDGVEGSWEPKEQAEEKSVEEWMKEGEKAIYSAQYLLALSLYDHGINQHPSSPDLLLARAQVCLTLERYSLALSSASFTLTLLPTSSPLTSTALLLQSRALYSLRRWSSALTSFQTLLAHSPSLSAALDGVSACQARLHEAQTGSYDIPALYALAGSVPVGATHPVPDVADYIGPVAVAPIPSKGGGRGLVATRDIEPGEVLLAVRAVALVSTSDLKEQCELWNLEEMVVDSSNSLSYVHNVLYRLRDQPELVPKVKDLYPGPRAEEPTPETFPMGAPSGEEVAKAEAQGRKGRGVGVTAQEIHRAIYYNASVPYRFVDVPANGGDPIAYGEVEKTPAALFSESAQINHACSWNAFHAFFASFQITTSTTPIPSGTEILASYTPDLPHAFRTPRLAKFFPSPCDCSLCLSDRLSPTLSARPGVIVKIMNDPAPPPTAGRVELEKALTRRQQLCDELRRTYVVPQETAADAAKRDKVDMFFAYQSSRPILLALARLPASPTTSDAWQAVLSNERSALESLGATLAPFGAGLETLPRYRHAEAVRGMLVIAGALSSSGGKGKVVGWEDATSEAWVGEAHRVERVCLGGRGREFFEGRWREVLRENGLAGAKETGGDGGRE